eukprot:COSAG01_NODE_1968_length_8769_cov_5.768166_3_plen_67_part_00
MSRYLCEWIDSVQALLPRLVGPVSRRAFPSWNNRSILTEIHLYHACSCQKLRMETPGKVAFPFRAT